MYPFEIEMMLTILCTTWYVKYDQLARWYLSDVILDS